MKPGVWFLSLTLALLSASPAFAQQESVQQESEQVAQRDGEHWYNFMSDALNGQNFEASLVYVLGERIEPYHWLHAVEPSGDQLELKLKVKSGQLKGRELDQLERLIQRLFEEGE